MKNAQKEYLRKFARQRQRHHPWNLEGGLYLVHHYPKPPGLTWWDDFGFVLNGRRILVRWVHPRMSYSDAIEKLAWGEGNTGLRHIEKIIGSNEKRWKHIGYSRKKTAAYRQEMEHWRKVSASMAKGMEEQMRVEGIDHTVHPWMTVTACKWWSVMDICTPVEMGTIEDVRATVALARSILKGETTLAAEFPGYEYGRREWLAEADERNPDGQMHLGGLILRRA